MSGDEMQMERVYEQNNSDFVVLYKLPKEMYNYVYVLCNNIKREISHDLTSINYSWEHTDDTIKSIMYYTAQEIGALDNED